MPLHKVHRQGSYGGSSTSTTTTAPQMPEEVPPLRAVRQTGLDACLETDPMLLSRPEPHQGSFQQMVQQLEASDRPSQRGQEISRRPEHHHSPWQQPETVNWRSQRDEEAQWRPEPHHGLWQQPSVARGMFDSPSKPAAIADWSSRRHEEEQTKRLSGGIAARRVFLRKLTEYETEQVRKMLLPEAERKLGDLAAKEFDWALSSGGGISARGEPPGGPICIDLCSALTALRQLAYLNGLPSLDAEAARQCLECPGRGVDLVSFKAALPKLLRSALAIEALASQH